MQKNTVQNIFFEISFWLLFVVAICGGIALSLCKPALSVSSSVAAADITTLQNNYQNAMMNYLQAVAQFNRDKKLYLNEMSDSNRASLLSNANKTYQTRREAVVAYIDYLSQLVTIYVTDEVAQTTLLTKLSTQRQQVVSLKATYTDLSGWYQIDADFTNVYTQITETASQVFAYVYWHELNNIIEEYVTNYQERSQTILDEAANQVVRTQKVEALAKTERELKNLQEAIKARYSTLATINSINGYESFRKQLDDILNDTESSLKVYASLE